MADPVALTLFAVLAVSALSLVGALTLTFRFLSQHTLLIGLVAVAAGTLVGDAFFHLLPEAVDAWGSFHPRLAALAVAGFLLFFLFEAALRWRHAHGEGGHEAHGGSAAVKPFGWLNLTGDGIHNFIDGVLIAAAFLVSVPVGIATAIAVAAHEIPQELGDFAVLLEAGVTPARALVYNFGSALLAFLGALLVLSAPIETSALQLYVLPLAAGGFLYIASADLVPELHHHTGGRHLPLVVMGLVAGLTAMVALLAIS